MNEYINNINDKATRLQDSLADAEYDYNAMVQQDQYADNSTTLGSELVTGNSVIDQWDAMAEEQALVDNSLDFIPGSRTAKVASKLNRFEREAATMARKPVKDFIQQNGRELRVRMQNNLSDMTLGATPKFNPRTSKTNTRWLDNPGNGTGASYTRTLNQVNMYKNTGKYSGTPGMQKAQRASDNAIQRINMKHEGVSGTSGHALDMKQGTIKANLSDVVKPNKAYAKSMGVSEKKLDEFTKFNQGSKAEMKAYNDGYKESKRILAEGIKENDKYKIDAGEYYMKWHEDMFAHIHYKIPKELDLYEGASKAAKRKLSK